MADVWYREWKDANDYQWRIEIMPPGSSFVFGTENFIEMDENILFEFGKLKSGWEKALVGLQLTDSMEMEVDARELKSDPDLRDAILQPTLTSAGSLDLGSGQTRTIAAGTVWTICCDYGFGYAPGSEGLRQCVVTQLMQRPVPGITHKIEDAGEEIVKHKVTITLIDIIRASMESILPGDLAKLTLNTRSGEIKGPFDYEIDTIYYDEAIDITYVRFEKEFSNPQLWRRFYPLKSLYDDLENLIAQAYAIIRRVSGASFGFLYNNTASGGVSVASVWRHWQLVRPNYEPDNQPVYPTSSAVAPYYRGTVHMADDDAPTDTSVPIGGILVDQNEDNQQSLFKFDTMFDFLKVTCESLMAVGKTFHLGWSTSASYSTRVGFYTIKTTGSAVASDDELPSSVEILDPGNIIAHGVAAIPGLEGDDQSEYKSASYWGSAVEDEQDFPIRSLWHTMPRVGDKDNMELSWRWSFAGSTAKANDLSVVSNRYIGAVSADVIAWKLYFFDQPEVALSGGGTKVLLDEEAPIRIPSHGWAAYGSGVGDKVFAGGGNPFPMVGTPASASAIPGLAKTWWRLWVAWALEDQRNAGLHQIAAEMVALVFGNKQQTVYENVELALSQAICPNEIGFKLQLGSTGNASVFLAPGDDDLDHLSTDCHMLAGETDLTTATINLTCMRIKT